MLSLTGRLEMVMMRIPCELVGETGRVFGFDVQERAIQNSETNKEAIIRTGLRFSQRP